MIIDAHVHLWKVQDGRIEKRRVVPMGNGIANFCGEMRQMLPPYIIDDKNIAEILISNMNFAQVSGAVAVQEYIDGNQDEYLQRAKKKYKNRIKICSLFEDYCRYEPRKLFRKEFDGVKICAGRLRNPDLTSIFNVFEDALKTDKFVAIDLSDGDRQVASLREIVTQLPNLRVAIGHFGMVTKENWQSQVSLARFENVYVESGGITWLYNDEFYPYPSAIRAIKKASEICGIEKLMWGSDYPRTMTAITYKMSYDFILKSNELRYEEKEKFLGENAKLFYRFSNLTDLPPIKTMVDK